MIIRNRTVPPLLFLLLRNVPSGARRIDVRRIPRQDVPPPDPTIVLRRMQASSEPWRVAEQSWTMPATSLAKERTTRARKKRGMLRTSASLAMVRCLCPLVLAAGGRGGDDDGANGDMSHELFYVPSSTRLYSTICACIVVSVRLVSARPIVDRVGNNNVA